MIYADNAATTKTGKAAAKAMLSCMERYWCNPSSPYTAAQLAAGRLMEARQNIALCLGCQAREIFFTSGGSESDNQALISAAHYGALHGKKHIVSTAFEHHAVLHTLKKLEKEGFEVTLISVHPDGIVTADQVEDVLAKRSDTALVSVMYANNEIGTIQPVREIAAVCRKYGVLFHTDAVQAAGHIPINVGADGIDMLSLSAHKFHGPKGIGLLYAKSGIVLTNLIEGGGQERGKRAGTENLPAIVGMEAALKDACAHMESNAQKVSAMRDRLIKGLLEIPGSTLNGDTVMRLPGNVNMCFEETEAEGLILLLDNHGICVSSGSACTSGFLDPSHVLLAIGKSPSEAEGSLRITLDSDNTMDEVEQIITAVNEAVTLLRS